MLTWMRCIGVFLDSPGIRSSNPSRCLVTSFGLAIFVFNVYRNGIIVASITEYLTNSSSAANEKQPGVAALWNTIIGSLNHVFVTFFPQLFLMSAAATKWSSLIQVLNKMENDNLFEPKDFQQFRRFFFSGILIIVTVGIGCSNNVWNVFLYSGKISKRKLRK